MPLGGLGTAAVVAGLADTAVKGTLGAAQFFKGRRLAKNLQRPEYQIPQEVLQNMTQAQQQYYEGLPASVKQQYIQNITRGTASALNAAGDRQAGLAGLGGIVQAQNDAYSNLAAQDAQARQFAGDRLMNARSAVAGYRDKAFDINKMQPYEQQAAAAQALKGSGLQNITGSLDTATQQLTGAAIGKMGAPDEAQNPAAVKYKKRFTRRNPQYAPVSFEDVNANMNEPIYNIQ